MGEPEYTSEPGPMKPGQVTHTYHGRVRQGEGHYYVEVRHAGGWKTEASHPGTYVIDAPVSEGREDSFEFEPGLDQPLATTLNAAIEKRLIPRGMKIAQSMNEKPGQKHVNLAIRQLIHDDEQLAAIVTFRIRRKA